MALIDKASLLMVPSTYEAGKLYNVLPSGNRAPDSTDQNSGYDQTRADFDFDRGSNASATRIGSDGLIKKYRENLLVQSNNFSNGWSLTTGSSITGGQTGYDGSNDAWLLNDSGNSTAYAIYRGYTNTGVQTFSLYAKQASTSQIEFDFLGGSGGYLRVELTDGSLHQTNNSIDYNIENVGNGWYRCSFAVNQTSAPILVRIGCNGAGSVYIQNAQVEKGLVASSYLDSTSVTAKAGVLVDLPRINYDANGENGALLLEPSRANLIPQSEYLAIGWTYDNTSVISNSIVSPTGEISASKLLDNTTNDLHRMYYITGTSASAHTFSIFLKKGEYSKVEIESLSGVTTNITYDLLNGTATSVGEIEPYGNDWYRCIFPMSNTSPSNAIQIRLVNNSNSNVFVGTGTSGVHMFGAMLEAGSYVSSYIPTMGTSETRAADSCSVTGASDVIGQTEGTIYCEFDFHAYAGAVDRGLISVAEAGQGYIDAIYVSSYNNDLYLAIYNGGAVQVNIAKSNISIGKHKIAIAYKANDFAYYLDGVQIGTDSSGSLPTPLNFVGIGNINGGYLGDFDTSEFILFKERLSNAELATLTTL